MDFSKLDLRGLGEFGDKQPRMQFWLQIQQSTRIEYERTVGWSERNNRSTSADAENWKENVTEPRKFWDKQRARLHVKHKFHPRALYIEDLTWVLMFHWIY